MAFDAIKGGLRGYRFSGGLHGIYRYNTQSYARKSPGFQGMGKTVFGRCNYLKNKGSPPRLNAVFLLTASFNQ
jgi:hypothetical protein